MSNGFVESKAGIPVLPFERRKPTREDVELTAVSRGGSPPRAELFRGAARHVMRGLAALLAIAAWSAVLASEPENTDRFRLGHAVFPLSQKLVLNLDPELDGYSGWTEVNVSVRVSTNAFRFHALDLDLAEARIDGQNLRLVSDQGLVTATAPRALSPGPHVLTLAFTNRFDESGKGLYKYDAAGTPALFTMMGAIDARRIFPCWDEPEFKIPWQVTVTAPSGYRVVANSSPAATTLSSAGRTVEFGRTAPMAAGLVALAVGQFEEWPVLGLSVPGSIFTPLNRGELSAFMVAESPKILDALEKYFQVPLPYSKLDQIVVWNHAFGGLASVGFIGYGSVNVLGERDRLSFAKRREIVELMAHETAHQWFGAYVTMRWWDDLWLAEGFSTWLGQKIAGQLHPEFRGEFRAYVISSEAREYDTPSTVEPMRRAFRGNENFEESFNTLNYNKGNALVQMVEHWVGEESFRGALKRFLIENRDALARSEDLWESFSAGEPALGEVVRRYVDYAGIPEVTFSRTGTGDRLIVSQRRYRTMKGPESEPQLWHIPVVIRYGGQGWWKSARMLLTEEKSDLKALDIDNATWIYPNANEAGHYIWSGSPELVSSAANHVSSLFPVEQIGMLDAVAFSVSSGKADAAAFVSLLLSLKESEIPEVQQRIARGLAGLNDLYFPRDTEAGVNYRELVRRTLKPVMNRIGFHSRHDQPPEFEVLRSNLIRTLGIVAGDPQVIDFSRAEVARQFAHPEEADHALASTVLEVATWHGDKAWLTQVMRGFESAQTPEIRVMLGQALGCVRGDALVHEVLNYSVSDSVRPDEFLLIGSTIAKAQENIPAVFRWISENYASLEKKIPDMLPYVPTILGETDPATLAQATRFFTDPSRVTLATGPLLAKVAESVELRESLRSLHTASVQALVDRLLNN